MAKVFNMTDDWNNAGIDYTAVKMNVSDQSSGANSKLIDLQVASSSRFSVDKTGNLTANSYSNLPADVSISGTPETTKLEVQNNLFKFKIPFAMNITEVRLFLHTEPLGSSLNTRLNLGSDSVLVNIDDGQDSNTISSLDIDIEDDVLITLDILQVGSLIPGSGLKVTLKGTRN